MHINYFLTLFLQNPNCSKMKIHKKTFLKQKVRTELVQYTTQLVRVCFAHYLV